MNKLLKWNLTGICQGFDNCTKVALQNIFDERLPMTAYVLKHDHDSIIIQSAESLKNYFDMKK